MKSHKHWLIAAKDLRELRANGMVLLPIILVPIVLCVVLPRCCSSWIEEQHPFRKRGAVYRTATSLLPGTGGVRDRVGAHALHVLQLHHDPLFMVIPLMVSSTIAAHAIAGEKERRTLETLLYTPITNRQFFLGKLLSAFLPALLVSFLSFALYFTTVNVLFVAMRGVMIIRSWVWLPAMLLINPAASLLGSA